MDKENFTKEEYERRKQIIVDNKIYTRHGWCNRCGKCCYEYYTVDGEKKFGKPCPHLIINDNGTTSCDIYENRPQSCKDFPLVPFSIRDEGGFEECGYTWEMDTDLTIEEALRRHKVVCSLCVHNEGNCEQRSRVIDEIYEKLEHES